MASGGLTVDGQAAFITARSASPAPTLPRVIDEPGSGGGKQNDGWRFVAFIYTSTVCQRQTDSPSLLRVGCVWHPVPVERLFRGATLLSAVVNGLHYIIIECLMRY